MSVQSLERQDAHVDLADQNHKTFTPSRSIAIDTNILPLLWLFIFLMIQFK